MLDELRQKPQHIRNRYAFFSALLITGIIAGFWFLSFGAKDRMQDMTDSSGSVVEDGSGILDSFTNVFRQSFQQVKTMIPEPVATTTESEMELNTENKPSSIDKVISDTFEDINNRQNKNQDTKRTVQIATSSTSQEASIE